MGFKLVKGELTDREREVFACLAKGVTSKEIAGSLNITTATVNTHRKNMLHKTGAKSSSELIALILSNFSEIKNTN